MKVEINNPKPEFTPIKLDLTIESKQELAELFAIVSRTSPADIKHCITMAESVPCAYSETVNGVRTLDNLYNVLKPLILKEL